MKKEILENKILNSWLRTLLLAVAIIVLIIMVGMLTLNWYTRHGERFAMPSLVGMTLEEAEVANQEMNITFEVMDSIYIESMAPGAILDQYPKAGNFIKSGRRITVVTNTYAPKNVKIPYVAGYSLRQAKSRLVSSGIQIDRLIYVEDMANNNIVRQEYNGTMMTPNSNITVPVNSKVTLYVGLGNGAATLKTPTVINEPYYLAKEKLWEEGINVNVREAEKMTRAEAQKATVYKQSPMPGVSLNYGDEVTLFISSDSSRVDQGLKNYRFISKQILELKDRIKVAEELLKLAADEEMIQYQLEVMELNKQLDSLKFK